MATNKNRNHSNPPPHKKSKKSKPADKMNVDNRDSLSEFQSSIFDASDGHQLVDFIRKKKGLRAQPQKIFDDVPTNRQSLHIEIQRLDEHENETTQPDKTNPQHAEECENQATNENNTQNGIVVSPKRMPIKSPMHSKTLFKRLSQSIGRRTLLKEFEKTLQESRFLPPTCSTPLTGDLTPNRDNTIKEKIESVNQGNLNIVCTPITITDEESPNPENRSKTTEMAKELEEQVDFVLERSSNEKLLVHDACAESEDDLPSSQRSITLRNRTTTPKKVKNRQTYTIERDDVSGNLILSPSKSTTRHSLLLPLPSPSKSTTRHSFLTKTPERRATTNMSPKLVVTPKQKQLLLSKFGRSSQVMVSPQKAPSPPRSRIPILVHGNTATNPVAPESDPYVESANLSQQHPETVKIIEQLQRKNTSNAPVIVIPVNQTFNQASNPESAASATFVRSPRPLEPVSTSSPAKSRTPQLPSVSSSSSSSAASTPIKMNSLRLKDILTDDESSDYHPNFSRSRKALRRKSKKFLNNSHSRLSSRPSNLSKNKLSLTAKPTLNASKVREVLNPQKLSRMSECEILDLRKRNSRGELRRSMNLTQRESSLLGKQMELELLRRNIQEKNYEDEVLQMEVIPPPPDEFCDRSLRRSQQEFCDRSLERSQKESSVHVNDEFVDEMSGDRVSLNRRERLSKSIVSQKPTRKKKKVLEHVERYLETSQKIQKSKFMNLSKRKLYNKGNSEECSSTDSQPLHKPTTPKQTTKRKSSQRKSTNVPSTPSRTQTQQSTQSPSPQRTPISSQQQQRKSNEFVNKTVPFLPQTNEVSAKPEKKKPKNNKKPKKPLGPVDPDRGTSFVSVNNQENLCRRSKREKKLPTAYWSSTQTEFRPLYDYHDVVNKMYHNNKKKPPTSEKTLVANTKTVRAGESTKSKKTSTKQHNQQRSSKQVKSTKKPADDASWENEIAANSQYYDDTNDLPQQKNSKSKSKQSKAKRDENEFSTQQLMDDPFPNITSEADVAPDPLPEEIEATLANNETNRTSLNFSKQPTVKLNPLSKSILSASVQASSGYSSDVSSVQQIRLATIDEDSVPTVHQANLNSTVASANENRLSRELMPPPPSTKLMRSKKSSSKVKNSKRSAFRTEHDKSIADVSSDHLNKLFDQLKNSSVSTSSEVAASIHQNNYSGQASAHSRPTESNSILERKCKKFSVRLQRMKAKEKSTYRSEKVCDSGFSSEDMSSVPKQKGDVLLNWLKQMIVNNKTPSGADKGVARILQSEGIHTSSVEDLIFQEIDGVEYAFYDTKAPFSIGYIRFNPKTGKKKSTAKKFELNFVILSGKVNIAVNDTKFDCKNGDLITVFIGTSYVIQNTSNDPALVMVIKK